MLRRVMVCLDDSNSGRMGLDAALRFATAYGSTLTGLLIREPPPPDQPVHDHEAAQDAREERLIHAFREACRSRALTHAWRVMSGAPGQLIPLAARAFDLVVIGRGAKPDSALGSVASTLVRELACPVMVVAGESSTLRTIAVAYDGSHGASRALALAADIAVHEKDPEIAVVLIGVDPGDDSVREAFVEAEKYLDAYHLAHRSHILEGPAADCIVDVARREKADVLVMGAYGRSRAHELLVGSTTEKVIDGWRGEILLWR